MSQGKTMIVRGIYRDGKLTLLEPIDLAEGQEVLVTLADEQTTVRAALADLIAPHTPIDDADFDEAALQKEIDDATQGVTVSDAILEERRTGR